MTRLRKMMLEELERRNYSEATTRCYIRTVEDFSRRFNCSPDRLGPRHIREYQAELFKKRKLSPGTVTQRLAALRFFYVKTLKKTWSIAETPYPKRAFHLPSILSREEVARLIDAALIPYHRTLLMTLRRIHIERSRKWITWKHVQVLLAIARCRTAMLGGHLDECTRCGHRAISYNSCSNRHCPKCQAGARERWLEKRRRELLPTPYVHMVFTLPRQLAPLTLQNKKVVYHLLFRTSAETLLEVARDPKHLGAEIGFFSVLHSWSQKLELHPHVHCVVPAGGLSADRSLWIQPRYAFFLPVKVLSRVFRGKFVAALQRAFQDGRLSFHGDLQPLAQPKTFAAWLRPLFRKDWVVYAKPPFGGPEHVLRYLGRYTHRVAISNHRLVSFADGTVTFRWRDSAHHNEQKLLPLSVDEFLRRFLLHLLPKGFVRIRNFGFLANRRRAATLPLCFQLLSSAQAKPEVTIANSSDAWLCPKCGGSMLVIERFTAAELQLRSPPATDAFAA